MSDHLNQMLEDSEGQALVEAIHERKAAGIPMKITEFLEARIAEDEAVASTATAGPWRWDADFGDENDTGLALTNDSKAEVVGAYNYHCCSFRDDPRVEPDDAVFIAHHDPARVLAECAAKRAILEQHKDWPVLVERKPDFSEDASDVQNMTYRVSQEIAWLTEREYVKRFGVEAPTTNMILALAAVYKDHPDYQQEWAL